jgi:hypothetical protein
MQNELLDLNFNKLLNYDLQELKNKGVLNSYNPPLTCTGFCIECERKGFVESVPDNSSHMSHGCDTSDFEQILGQLRVSVIELDIVPYDKPILFLLQDPGPYWESSKKFLFNGITKQPPTKHYYWTPHKLTSWPTPIWNKPGSLGEYYGDYFAYLMVKHGLTNVYITNIIKCSFDPKPKDLKSVTDYCVEAFFSREIKIIKPQMVFCFGRTTEEIFRSKFHEYDRLSLYHPSYIARPFGGTREEKVRRNDDSISSRVK